VQLAARNLRLRQIKAEVTDSVELFRFHHGEYPTDLSQLVTDGMLASSTQQTVSRLGWTYSLLKKGRGYSLAL
jgi:competence protein ComGC